MENLSISDVLYNIQSLDVLPVFDNQTLIEGASAPIDVRTNFDTNFQDREAFITGHARYSEEATYHGELNVLLDEGFKHAANLYTWRCISLGVPVVKSNEQSNRLEINEKVVEVLKPEVQKLFDLMDFVNAAMAKFVGEVARLSHTETRKEFVSEAYLLTLGKCLNMFIVLDELKNIKASMKNDMSTYRRANQSLGTAHDLHKLQVLSMFFATHNRIRDTLKEELIKIEGYEELLADIVNICVHFFEQRFYVNPDEKHLFVKVIAFSLFLIDGAPTNVVKMDQKKRLNIQRFDKIFKSMPVLPLFGDMPTYPFDFIKKSPNYDASKWPLSNQTSVCNVNIVDQLKQIRLEHTVLCKRLARIKNEDSVVERDNPRPDEENREITELARSSLQCLCNWSSLVIELITWKLANPTNPQINPECPIDCTEDYEKATRYNLSVIEKAAIVEVIGMIKDLQCQLNRMEFLFSTSIRRHIYSELQDFTQITIRDPLHKALKHKKDVIATIITSIIDTCSDGSQSIASSSQSSDLSIKKKKDKKDRSVSLGDVRPKRRNVPPSHTQLYLMRTMLESLVSEKASGGRRVLRKDIEPKQSLDKMIVFLRNSYFWPYLLKFTECLEVCCDLSQFWFREFHLEIATGKRIQFPIEMSIPWILTDYVLTSQDPSLLESVLYQLDLYNDAANYSLKRFRKSHLYDEIEAEVNLCFDQFIYKLSDAVFTHYKQLAASMLLDKGFKNDCLRLAHITLRTPPATRFESLLKQRHFQLLGRSIDLNRLISQRINVALANSLDVAISKFESEGLWYIVALDHLIETNRLCHRLLSEHLTCLNDFNEMLLEANHQVYMTNGRITLHVYTELTGEIIPNYYYNTFTQRFVHGRQPYRDPPVREKFKPVAAVYEFGSKSLNASFANISAMHRNYIGTTHFSVIAKLLGYQGISSILEGLLVLCKSIIDEQLKPNVQRLYNLVSVCKLPRYDYGAEAILQYYLQPISKMINYEPLRKEFAQGLREFGNIVTLCFQIETGMSREDLLDLHNSGPFTHAIPKFSNKNTQETQQKYQRLVDQASRIQIAAKVQLMGNESQASIANDAELLTKERLCCGLNSFESSLSKIAGYLMADPIWRNNLESPPNRVMFIDECNEFHRLWSHIQFALLVMQMERGNADADLPTIDEIFGDSLTWAGMTIIRLLNQHRRFDVIDFAYHLLRVYRTEPRPLQQPNNSKQQNGSSASVKLNSIIERIRYKQSVNTYILSILAPHLTTVDRENEKQLNREFGPPVHARMDDFKQLHPLMDIRTNRNIGPELSQMKNNEMNWDEQLTPRLP